MESKDLNWTRPEACQRCSRLGDLGMLEPAYGRHGNAKLTRFCSRELQDVKLVIFPPTTIAPTAKTPVKSLILLLHMDGVLVLSFHLHCAHMSILDTKRQALTAIPRLRLLYNIINFTVIKIFCYAY